MADLYSEYSRELQNCGLFLEALRKHFENHTSGQRAKAELLALWQRGRPVANYIRDFRWLSGKLRGWPKWLMVHQFKTGLDCMVCQACVYQGLPLPLECLVSTIELEAELHDFRLKDEVAIRPR